MNILFIGSGSKGNGTIIYDNETTILIDCGISKRRINNRLKEINKTFDDIDYVLITHNHIDHVSGLKNFSKEKIYSVDNVVEDLNKSNILMFFEEKVFKSFVILPIPTSHDASNSCGYIIKNNNEELVYITDTGYLPDSITKYLYNKEYYIFESNHDLSMLIESNRSTLLKARILSTRGHLSNDQSSEYLSLFIGDKTKFIALAHLSEECNESSIAIHTHIDRYNEKGIDINNINLIALKQWEDLNYVED